MSFLKKLFSGFGFKDVAEEKSCVSKYLSNDKIIPMDEEFTLNFKKNGGKFIYCLNREEATEAFENILLENDWFEKEALTVEKSIYSILDQNNVKYINTVDPIFFVCNCESLIAEDGSILLSSNQLSAYKLSEIPENIIIFGKISQLIPTKSDGLSIINNLYKNNLPFNITSFKNYDINSNENDFLNYGSIKKNIYLILQEDL